MFTLGIVLGEIGERIPVWNKYCGGGALLVFFVCGLLSHLHILPECVVENATGWMNDYSFLNLFISFLIVGSLLGLDRKLLIRSSSLFLPTILAGVAGAVLFGALGGMLFGVNPLLVVTSYVLPIMGGGAGIFLTGGFFVLAQLFAKKILPSVAGVSIPSFAYLISYAQISSRIGGAMILLIASRIFSFLR